MLTKLKSSAALAALVVFAAACGGAADGASASDKDAKAAEEKIAQAEQTVEAETMAAVDTAAETVEAAAQDASDTASSMIETAAEKAGEVAEDVEASVQDAAADVETASESAVAIAPEIAQEYASLTGDAAQGKKVFYKCISCHAVDEGVNKVGPSLYGIVGRPAGSIEGFKYSDANANSGIVWTEETLFAYLEKPQEFIKGTRMAFPGLPVAQDRADIIAYLKENG